MKKRKLVNAFSILMEEEMAANESKHKKNPWWEDHGLFIHLEKEIEELDIAMEYGDPEIIKREAADVANIAMMIAGRADPKWRKFKND